MPQADHGKSQAPYRGRVGRAMKKKGARDAVSDSRVCSEHLRECGLTLPSAEAPQRPGRSGASRARPQRVPPVRQKFVTTDTFLLQVYIH